DHDGAGALLARQRHRGLEVDLLAPGHGRGRERQRRHDRLRGRRVEQFGIEGEGAEVETDALSHDGLVQRAEKRTEPRTPVHDRQESIAQPTSRVQSPAGGIMLQLQSALGIIALLAIAWAISEHRRNVAWRPVLIGLALTITLAFVLIKVPKVAEALAVVNRAVGAVAAATQAGTSFVFGYL